MSIVWQRIKPKVPEFHGRISTDKNDSGYQNYLNTCGLTIRVLLNGIEQDDCEMADTVAGEVLRLKLDNRGEPYCVGDQIAKEIAKGHVQILVGK